MKDRDLEIKLCAHESAVEMKALGHRRIRVMSLKMK